MSPHASPSLPVDDDGSVLLLLSAANHELAVVDRGNERPVNIGAASVGAADDVVTLWAKPLRLAVAVANRALARDVRGVRTDPLRAGAGASAESKTENHEPHRVDIRHSNAECREGARVQS